MTAVEEQKPQNGVHRPSYVHDPENDLLKIDFSEYNIDYRKNLDVALAKRQPLRDWLILSAVCLGLAAFVCGKSIFSALWKDHTGITFCIAVFFVLAFTKSLIDAFYIAAEFRKTDMEIRGLVQGQNLKSFLAHAQACLFRHHVGNLLTIFDRDDLIEQDNLVELMHARLRARFRSLDLAASTMVSLGLVGTIIGLIASVGGLSDAMNHAGTDAGGLQEGMNTTLRGMGTAFSATLMGAIFGGVVLRLIYSSLNSQAEHLVAYIAELTEVLLLPVLRSGARQRRIAAKRGKTKLPAGS